jgi:hypothetical protein
MNCLRRAGKLAWIAVSAGLAGGMFNTAALGAQAGPLHRAWLSIRSGTPAYTGDDGGSVATLTVCRSPQAYVRWLDSGDISIAGCESKPRGIPVVILSEQPSAWDFGSITPLDYLVEIRAADGSWQGWTNPGSGLQPRIPVGTRLILTDAPHVFIALDQRALPGEGQLLDQDAQLVVVAQDPASTARDLQVRVLGSNRSGALAVGWIYSMYVLLPDGAPLLFQSPARLPPGSAFGVNR